MENLSQSKNQRIKEIISEAEKDLTQAFASVDAIALENQRKVLNAFRHNKIALRHLAPSTGYGYGDEGRDTLNSLFAEVFGAEDAIVSPAIASGTHALTIALFGILRPNDLFVSVTGAPYDTLSDVIGGCGNGSLKDFGIAFDQIELTNSGNFDYDKIFNFIEEKSPKMVYVQRSRGYAWRNSLSSENIGELVSALRKKGYEGCIFVDNCYGEFSQCLEPTDCGADVICGSLIKNPGGGICPTGGYVAGKSKYIKMVADRLTAPSIGTEVGSYAYGYQYFYQGLFIAPHTVAQSLKGSLLFGQIMARLGYKTMPPLSVAPTDITRSIMFNTEKQLIDFISSIQAVSPIDSFVKLEPWDMPGYNHKVIMAAGCFVQGASIELSADAPIKEPYIAYIQGGLTYEHCKLAAEYALEKLI